MTSFVIHSYKGAIISMQPKKYQNKYLVQSNRLLDWDYSANGGYFITVCAQGKKECLGNILIDDNHEPSIALSEIGQIVRDELLKTPQIRPNVKLDEWVIMPNHIHAIFIINNVNDIVETPRRGVSTGNNPKWKPGVLGSIINQFKGMVTRECHKRKLDFQWQPRFYDHIIRTESTLQKIREYIKYNPLKWKWDRNNPKNS